MCAEQVPLAPWAEKEWSKDWKYSNHVYEMKFLFALSVIKFGWHSG
jgi:hypothetical protein